MARFKQWFFGLPRRRQDYLAAGVILLLLFVLTSPPIAPYASMAFWAANLLFWAGAALVFIIGFTLWVSRRR